MKVYKIFNTESKLYSKGGMGADHSCYSQIYWSKKGKVWNGIGPLKLHLKQFKKIPATWQVHEFEVREELTKILWPDYIFNKQKETK